MLRILYADDESGLLEIGKLFLQSGGGFSVTTVTSATAALPLLDREEYDAVISDYQMPGMDGLAFLKAVRAQGNTIPFILFTGRGREEVVIEAINNGADFYLQKGGEPQSQFAELAHKIRQAVSRRSAEQALKDSEQRLSDIINFLPDATFAIDRSGMVIAWNRAIEEMTGVPAADMLGKGNFEYALPFYNTRRKILIDLIFEPDEVIEKNYSHITHQKDLLIAETTFPHPKGREVTLLGKASPLYDRKRAIVGAIESIRDITELRKAEHSLRESEQRYREVVETQTEFVCRFRPDGTHVFVNEAFCRHFGKTREEIIGHRFVPEIPEEERELVRRHFASFSLQHPTAEIEHRIVLPDGTVRWHWWNDHALFDTDGHIIEFQSIGKDITDRKRAEEDLKQSENLYRTIFDYTGAASIIIGPDTTILRANEGWKKLTGKPLSEQENRLSWTIFFSAEDRERMKGYHYARRKDPAHVLTIYESHLIDTDGRIHNVIVNVGLIPGTKNSVASLVDITEQRKAGDDLRQAYEKLTVAEEQLRAQFDELKISEQKIRRSEKDYRAILENIQDVFYRTDTAGNLVFASPSFADVLGHSPESSLYGKSIAELLYANPDERRKFLAAIEKTGSVTNYEVLLKKADGTPVTVITSSHKYYDDDGRFLGIEGIFRDITDRKTAEEMLQQAHDELERRVQERTAALKESEERLHLKLDSVLSPDADISELELANIIDIPLLHSLMEEFTRLTGITIAILDLKGNVIEASGWQEICTRFHRVHATTAQFCRQSDLLLAKDLRPGEFRTYKCKNGLWDAVMPLYIGGNHVGNIYTGQLFFNDEIVDEAFFEKRAGEFGFDTEAYLAALRRVPRHNRDAVMHHITFLVKFTNILSRLSYSNLKLAKSMADEVRTREALVLSERRLSDIIDHLPDATFAIDMKGTVITWNNAMAEMSGIPAPDILGKGDFEYALPLYGDRRPIMIDRVFQEDADPGNAFTFVRKKGPAILGERDLTLPDGRKVTLWAKVTALRDNEGNPVGAIESIRDVTEWKSAERELRALSRELEERVAERTRELSRAEAAYRQANQKLTLLSGITRHDIKNQLLSLSGFLEFSKRTLADPKATAEFIAKEERIANTIAHQINFTREYEDIGVRASVWQKVNETIQKVITRLPMRNIRTDAGDANLEIFADPLVEKVFYNLIDNSLKYGGKKMTGIHVSNEEVDGRLLIRVEDDGEGISKEDKQQLFTKGFGKHTGLGLYLSREILSITDISITENGEPGKGARFEISVPKGAWRFVEK